MLPRYERLAHQPLFQKLTTERLDLRGHRFALRDVAAVREQFVEISDRPFEAGLERRLRLPFEDALRLRDVRAALDRVVDRQRLVRDLRTRSGQLDDKLR